MPINKLICIIYIVVIASQFMLSCIYFNFNFAANQLDDTNRYQQSVSLNSCNLDFKKLHSVCLNRKLKVKDVASNGNCMFSTLSIQFCGNKKNNRIRHLQRNLQTYSIQQTHYKLG